MKEMTKNNQDNQPAQVLRPADDVFGSSNVLETHIVHVGQKYPIYERTEYPAGGGIYVYYRGMKFPKKGFPFPEAVWGNDVVKRISTMTLNILFSKDTLVFMPLFLILPWKKKMKVLHTIISGYTRAADWIAKSHFLKIERMSNPCRSLYHMTCDFLKRIGLERDLKLAMHLATMIEYDDAYRYRLEDVFSETSREELLKAPIKETRRLIQIFFSRELVGHVKDKFKMLAWGAPLILLHPRVRRAFKQTLRAMTDEQFDMLKLDNADRYHVLLRGDYNFTGRSFAVRQKIYIDFHTKSECCKAGVGETQDGEKFIQICKNCGKPCTFIQDFHPEVEIKTSKTEPQ